MPFSLHILLQEMLVDSVASIVWTLFERGQPRVTVQPQRAVPFYYDVALFNKYYISTTPCSPDLREIRNTSGTVTNLLLFLLKIIGLRFG